MVSFLNFCLSGKDFISPSFWKNSFVGYGIFISIYSPALGIYHPILLSPASVLLTSLLLVRWRFFYMWLDNFLMFFCNSFCLNSLIITGLRDDFFGLNLFGVLWASWIWRSISLPKFGKISAIILLNKLSVLFSISSTEISRMQKFD